MITTALLFAFKASIRFTGQVCILVDCTVSGEMEVLCECGFLCHSTYAGGKSFRGEKDGQSDSSKNDSVLRKLASLSVEDDQPASSRDGAVAAVGSFGEKSLPSVDGRSSCQSWSHVTNVRPVCTDESVLAQAKKEGKDELFDSSCANHHANDTDLELRTQHCALSSSCESSYGFGSGLLTCPPSALSALSGSSYGFDSDSLTHLQGFASSHDTSCGFNPESFTYRETSLCGCPNSDDSDPESLTWPRSAPSAIGSFGVFGRESLTCPHHAPSDSSKPYHLNLESLTCPCCILLDSDSDREIPPLGERMKLVTSKKSRPVLGSFQFPIVISD